MLVLTGMRKTAEVKPPAYLPRMRMQGPLAIWDEIVTPCTEAPREYLWASCLVTIGLVLGRNVRIENPRPLYPNFYALLMGPTGDRKARLSILPMRRFLSSAWGLKLTS